MVVKWEGCCYLGRGWTEAGNREEYSLKGGDSGWMGEDQTNGLRLKAGH